MEESEIRKAVVQMINILGAPLPPRLPATSDGIGFEYENYEAAIEGLVSLGYLTRTYTQTSEPEETPVRLEEHFDPDPVTAYCNFWEKEFGEPLPHEWREIYDPGYPHDK